MKYILTLSEYNGKETKIYRDNINDVYIEYQQQLENEIKLRKSEAYGNIQFISIYTNTGKTTRLIIHTKLNKMQQLS